MSLQINPCRDPQRRSVAAFADAQTPEALRETVKLIDDLFDEAPGTMLVFTGPDHIVRAANPAYFAFTGLTPQIIGKPAREALVRGYARGFGRLLDQVYASGKPLVARGAKLTVNRAPGAPDEEAYGDFALQPLKDRDGRVFGIFCQGHEVTNETRAREALEANRDALKRALDETRTILDHSHDVICVADREGRFARVSRQAEAMWGYRPEELLGRRVDDVIHPEDREKSRQMGQQVRAGVPTNAFCNRILHKDGAIVPMMWSASHSADNGSNVCIGRDMREHLAAEEKLRQAQKMEAIGRLTGGIAHDFNNLLAVVVGSAEALAEQLSEQPDLRDLAEVALNAAERGADLVSRLLAFARSQPLSPQPIDCEVLLTGLRPMLQRALGGGVEIELAIAARGLTCIADRSQLTSAMLNLCINARDAMPAGGRIVLSAEPQVGLDGREFVALGVEDCGEGMSAEVRARALEPFFTTKPDGRGSGLGLSMVHGFISQSDGRMEIVSAPGEGTTVCLCLPRTEACAGPCDIAAAPGAALGAAHILLVEDHGPLREQVRGQLIAQGLRVTACGDAAEALDAIARVDFDLLLTDIVMPGGLSGLQLADEARTLRPSLPVLFTTGHADEATLAEIRTRDAGALLTKPYRRGDLLTAIARALEPA